MGRHQIPLADRFWAKVQKTDSCWLWTANKGRDGYGRIKLSGTRLGMRAPRASWLVHFGDIPTGLLVCHRCDTPLCVRPDHLFLGTVADNSADMARKGRMKKIPREQHARGERCHTAKLSSDRVLTIRERYAAGGISQTLLAREYGVVQTVISRIVHRKIWTHI